jgi:ketosteroid isomerase-like protein
MRSIAPCPSDWALEQYVLEELAQGAAAVADHVSGCRACRDRVAEKQADSADFMRSAGADEVRRRLSSAPAATALPRGRRSRRSIFAGLALAAALAASLAVWPRDAPPAATAHSATDVDVVLRVQREWMEAIRDKDVAALDRILADDYTYTDSRGRVSGKADSLRQARAAGGRMKAFHTAETKAQVHGDLAVVTGRLRIEGESGGETYDTEVRFTDILARIDGQWRAVAAHASTPSSR